jgi:hypothetical protein
LALVQVDNLILKSDNLAANFIQNITQGTWGEGRRENGGEGGMREREGREGRRTEGGRGRGEGEGMKERRMLIICQKFQFLKTTKCT